MESIAQAINKSSNAAQSLNHSNLMKQEVSCPSLDEYNNACTFTYDLKYMIIHLNDEHKWSREDIADWLDTLENQPVFYPDIRTDDEKIEEAEKDKDKFHSVSNALQKLKEQIKAVSAYGVNDPTAAVWVKSPQLYSEQVYIPDENQGWHQIGWTHDVEFQYNIAKVVTPQGLEWAIGMCPDGSIAYKGKLE